MIVLRKLLLRGNSELSQVYSKLAAQGKIEKDKCQERVLGILQSLYTDLHSGASHTTIQIEQTTTVKVAGWFSESTETRTTVSNKQIWRPIRGVYLFGGPGSGKTFIMDLFYDQVQIQQKRRVHFNQFMLEVHELIHRLNQTDRVKGDPVPRVAQELSKETRLLCFDEFQVTDIADAMILKRLFGTLWDEGVVVVSTSNRTPDTLYYNGLQRFLFLPFIDELKKHCEVVDIESLVDYRQAGEEVKSFLYPLDKETETKAYKMFTRISGKEKGKTHTLAVMQGRQLVCRFAAGNCGMFTFKELCDMPLGAADYIALASHFSHVILTGVPNFSIHKRDIMRRFILLIDELYNKKVKLVVTASSPIEELYTGETGEYDEIFAFQRTTSRLMEMQTEEYQNSPHLT